MKGYDENTKVELIQQYNLTTYKTEINKFFSNSKDKIIIDVINKTTSASNNLYHTTYIYYKLKPDE